MAQPKQELHKFAVILNMEAASVSEVARVIEKYLQGPDLKTEILKVANCGTRRCPRTWEQ